MSSIEQSLAKILLKFHHDKLKSFHHASWFLSLEQGIDHHPVQWNNEIETRNSDGFFCFIIFSQPLIIVTHRNSDSL